jgi:nucleotide-binding universal stress UspA family protein
MPTRPITPPLQDGERIEQRDDIGRLIGVMQRFGHSPGVPVPRILVAIDGTEVSLALIDQLLIWQLQYGWQMDTHLLLVQDFLGKEAAEQHLEGIGVADSLPSRQRLIDAGIAHTLHLAMGDPAPRILERATGIGATLILMGTRGHGVFGSALLGSVAYKVVHASMVPVTLIRA